MAEMDLPSSKVRQEFTDGIKLLEVNIKDIANGTASPDLSVYTQKKLDVLAERFQHNEQLGSIRYKLYEMQALLYYFQNRDDALEFIEQAIAIKGSSYQRAEQLIDRIRQSENVAVRQPPTSPKHTDALPLELQSFIKGLHTYAIVMAVISLLSIYFIPWSVFYIILATKLKPNVLPSRKMIKGTAIATLPLCLGVLPILIDAEFWRMNRKLKEFEEKGAKAFMSDKEYAAGEPKRKKSKKIAISILTAVVVILLILIGVAIVTDNSRSRTTGSSGSFLTSETPTPFTSAEHHFVINFPGFPEREQQTTQVSGYDITYTIYSADTDNGHKAYLVGVYDYTGISLDETGALEGAVNGAVQNTEGARLISSNFSTFLGTKSIDAHYIAPVEGTDYESYIRGFMKDGKMYAVITIGETESGFADFVNSFKFQS